MSDESDGIFFKRRVKEIYIVGVQKNVVTFVTFSRIMFCVEDAARTAGCRATERLLCGPLGFRGRLAGLHIDMLLISIRN